MIDGILNHISLLLGYFKDTLIKYIIKDFRKENRFRRWNIFFLFSLITIFILLLSSKKDLFLVLFIFNIFCIFYLKFLQSGKLKEYQRKKELGKYYPFWKKQKNDSKQRTKERI